MAFCSQCGLQHVFGARFCAGCGFPVPEGTWEGGQNPASGQMSNGQDGQPVDNMPPETEFSEEGSFVGFGKKILKELKRRRDEDRFEDDDFDEDDELDEGDGNDEVLDGDLAAADGDDDFDDFDGDCGDDDEEGGLFGLIGKLFDD